MSAAEPANRTHNAEQLEALLAAFLREEGAGERRARTLRESPELSQEERAVLAALDTIIDGLVARARPRTGAVPRPRTEVPVAPPPVPPPPPRPPAATTPPETPIDPGAVEPRGAHHGPHGQPPHHAESGPPPIIEPIAARHPATQLLYDDVLNLSHINDWDAAFISIERMLVMAKVEGHILDFVKSNETHLLGLYEPALKSFGRVPKRRELKVENRMPRAFLGNRKVGEVLELVDRKLSIKKMFETGALSKLEICATLAVLQRAGVIEV
jgi:hypothetical protein